MISCGRETTQRWPQGSFSFILYIHPRINRGGRKYFFPERIILSLFVLFFFYFIVLSAMGHCKWMRGSCWFISNGSIDGHTRFKFQLWAVSLKFNRWGNSGVCVKFRFGRLASTAEAATHQFRFNFREKRAATDSERERARWMGLSTAW